jgi:Na+/glutamate symporter
MKKADKEVARCQCLAIRIAVVLFCIPLASCVRAPSFNILGSYFPAWMFCVFAGIVITVLVRLLVRRSRAEQHFEPLVLTYPCMAAFFAFSLWLVFFS